MAETKPLDCAELATTVEEVLFKNKSQPSDPFPTADPPQGAAGAVAQLEQPLGLTCMFCTQTFTQACTLDEHVLELHRPKLCEPLVHPQEKGSHTPSMCEEEEEEEDEKEDGEDGELSCEVCGQTFPTNFDVETHVRTHKNAYTYSCHLCPRRFKRPWFLKSHLRKHSTRAPRKRKAQPEPEPDSSATINDVVVQELPTVMSAYKTCMSCGFLYPDRDSLVEHWKLHTHGEAAAAAPPDDVAVPPGDVAAPEDNVATLPDDMATAPDDVPVPPEEGTVHGLRLTPPSTPPVPNNDDRVQFMQLLNLMPQPHPEATQQPVAKGIPQLDPVTTYQAWQLVTKGVVAVCPKTKAKK